MESPEPEEGLATPIGMRRDDVPSDTRRPGFFFLILKAEAGLVGGGGGLGGEGIAGMEGEPPPKHISCYSNSF